MPTSCAIATCSTTGESGGKGPSFFKFPKILYPNNRRWKNIPNVTDITTKRRQKWKSAVRRNYTEEEYSNAYVCFLHFKSGKK